MKEQLITFETAVLAKEKGFVNGTKGCFIIYKEDNINPKGNKGTKKGEFEYCKRFSLKNGELDSDEDYKYLERPTQSLLQKWLREVHNINVWVSSKTTDKGNTIYIPHGRTIPDTIVKGLVKDVIVYKTFDKWEEAFEFGLQEALKLIEIVN